MWDGEGHTTIVDTFYPNGIFGIFERAFAKMDITGCPAAFFGATLLRLSPAKFEQL